MQYAYDNFLEVPSQGEVDREFQLNHFYDEPSPDLFSDAGAKATLGVRFPRTFSFRGNLPSA